MENIIAKKSLGQNFLRSQKALETIVQSGSLTPEDIVLEIGPGEGVLTERLLASAKQVIAIEKDHRLIPSLQEKFAKEIDGGKLKLIEGDILTTDIENIIPTENPYKLIANIPYYITGEILRMFLEKQRQPEKIVLLVQKEVADRIMARDGKESILSLSVKVYGNPKREMVVEKKSFKPVPKVDSAILSIADISKNRLEGIPDDFFFMLIKTGFGQKRKQLAGNLTKLFSKEHIDQTFSVCNIPEKSRAEDLTLPLWISLCKNFLATK